MSVVDPQFRAPQPCPTDRPVGATIVVFSAILFAVALYIGLIAWAVFEMFAGGLLGGRSAGFYMGTSPQPEPFNPAWVLLGLFIIACGAVLATGLGIMRSQPWGFRLGIVIFGLLILFGNGYAVFGGAIVLYCVLRLLRKI